MHSGRKGHGEDAARQNYGADWHPIWVLSLKLVVILPTCTRGPSRFRCLAILKALPQPDNKERTAVEFKAPCVYQTRARVIGHERAAVEMRNPPAGVSQLSCRMDW